MSTCELNPADVGMPLILRDRAESAVGLVDCGDRPYEEIEREDMIRYVLLGAEIQRDKDFLDR